MLHVIFSRLCLGHLSVHVGDSSRCSKEIIKKILNCTFECRGEVGGGGERAALLNAAPAAKRTNYKNIADDKNSELMQKYRLNSMYRVIS